MSAVFFVRISKKSLIDSTGYTYFQRIYVMHIASVFSFLSNEKIFINYFILSESFIRR